MPERPALVDVGLATLALLLIALDREWTRREVWAASPAATAARPETRILAAATLAALLLIAAAGALWFRTALVSPLSSVGTFVAFVPWAWLQQAVFQFYLLGRLRLLLPDLGAPALAGVNALIFAAVHAPEWELVVVTAPAGWLWSLYYLRARRLLPIALSHAALGTGYFYWVRGDDLIARWLEALR